MVPPKDFVALKIQPDLCLERHVNELIGWCYS